MGSKNIAIKKLLRIFKSQFQFLKFFENSYSYELMTFNIMCKIPIKIRIF